VDPTALRPRSECTRQTGPGGTRSARLLAGLIRVAAGGARYAQEASSHSIVSARHQDDHCRRAAHRHRRNHPRDHLPLVRLGMNVIVNDSTKWVRLIILLIMLAISLTLLRWARNRAGGDQPTGGGVRKG
jgi:hypothetical protein